MLLSYLLCETYFQLHNSFHHGVSYKEELDITNLEWICNATMQLL